MKRDIPRRYEHLRSFGAIRYSRDCVFSIFSRSLWPAFLDVLRQLCPPVSELFLDYSRSILTKFRIGGIITGTAKTKAVFIGGRLLTGQREPESGQTNC
jgi:hypothetical protein